MNKVNSQLLRLDLHNQRNTLGIEKGQQTVHKPNLTSKSEEVIMVSYRRLTQGECYQIEALVARNISIREIARQLGRSPSTISRETRSKGSSWGSYGAKKAWKQRLILRHQPKPSLYAFGGKLEDHVRTCLMLDWSPEQIAGRLAKVKNRSVLSYQSIYRYIARDRKGGGHLYKHLRILRKPRREGSRRHVRLQRQYAGRNRIDQRPAIIEKRKRIGDYERDTVLGSHNGSLLLSIVDRTSRYLKLGWLPKKSKDLAHQTTLKLLQKEPVRSITNDNGPEFMGYKQTQKALKIKVYFSQAYRSWERGTNENLNGLIRQYFPRKKDIGVPLPKEIKRVEDLLNQRPRKCLGYATPLEVHNRLKRQVLR